MAAITKTDLKTHIYAEITDVITRSDDTVIDKAIEAGEGEMKSFLNRFDKDTMFTENFEDEYFKSLLKDIVCWHLIKLANPNINLELFRTAYEDAIKALRDISKGNTSPVWPLAPNNPNTDIEESGHIEFASNTKRINHY